MDLEEISKILFKAFATIIKFDCNLKIVTIIMNLEKILLVLLMGYHNQIFYFPGYAVEIEDINHVEILRIKNEI